MSGVNRFRSLSMRVRRSSKLRGNGGTYTLSFTKPYKKKSRGVMSGDLGSQGSITLLFAPKWPIHRLGITLFRDSRTSRFQCGGAPSC
ncbi:hypothetical protein AVEN_172610-1 [Araneus ventricosus]|uniref:Uncharacterized protein n=1 Tax=Araneus ventricosus TaxID=182803 RepID=A0A4Y2WKY7_ARAVE|nr:hypothetical protein AVEN_167780-1 [Araneus ventricosus]GBO37317.1 hypothetical protein AVEN_172610-1 [Araneus ventricosus]